MTDAYQAYKTYLNLKLHFTKKNFNYFSVSKNRVSQKALEARRDKGFFYVLSKVKDLENFLIANFVVKDKFITDLVDKESETVYMEWLKRQESITYIFRNEIEKMDDDLNKELKVVDGQHPMLLVRFMRKEISIETLIILNEVLTFFKHWEYNIQEGIIWKDIQLKCEKYRPFLKFDVKVCKSILKERFT